MIFYKNIDDLSEQIVKISKDEKLRKKIGKNGKMKYMKYFNSNLVAQYIINKTLDIPIELSNLFDKKEKLTILPNNSEVVKNYLLQNI